ncbi:MAG: hypothetical protein LC723_01035 [Actinobacteria bacterium]|nr:hypothetical protein [Actinomycetota bacterium]
MAASLAAVMNEACSFSADAIVWVPASPRRHRERGFDHAGLLAHRLGELKGIPVLDLLFRTKDVPPQVKLDPLSRRSNLDSAFACRFIAPDKVLVVDDVYTTGASASEAARALKVKGASKVYTVAIARTLPAHRSRPYNRNGLPSGSVVAGS